MKPIPQAVLLALLVLLCALCTWQWHREAQLRGLLQIESMELSKLQIRLSDSETAQQAANAEVLRLTTALNELRTNSLPLERQQEMEAAAGALKTTVAEQSQRLAEQNEALSKAGEAIGKANVSIQKLVGERDDLAKKLNALTLRYNKLAGG